MEHFAGSHNVSTGLDGRILKQTLTEHDKLKLKSDFMLVREKGKKQTSPFAVLLYLVPDGNQSLDSVKCGIICSRRFDRRAVRRIMPCQMIFIPRREILNARMQDVAVQMEMMFFRAKILMHSQK